MNKKGIISIVLTVTSIGSAWISGYLLGDARRSQKDMKILKEVENELRDIADRYKVNEEETVETQEQ